MFIFLSLFLTCQNDDYVTIKGELTFKLVDPFDFNNLSKDQLEKFQQDLTENSNPKNQEILNYIDILKQNEIIGKQSFLLKLNSKYLRVYTDKKEYTKVGKHTSDRLTELKKKAVLVLEGYFIEKELFFADKVKVELEDGETIIRK